MIRKACKEDIPAIYDITCWYIKNTPYNLSWNCPDYGEYEKEQQELMEHWPYFVSEMDGKVTGFGYVHEFMAKDAYQYDGEITIYFAPGPHYGQPSLLLEALEEQSLKENRTALIACITACNKPSIGFFEKHGYEQYGLLKKAGKKDGIWQDVCWMVKYLKQREDSVQE